MNNGVLMKVNNFKLQSILVFYILFFQLKILILRKERIWLDVENLWAFNNLQKKTAWNQLIKRLLCPKNLYIKSQTFKNCCLYHHRLPSLSFESQQTVFEHFSLEMFFLCSGKFISCLLYLTCLINTFVAWQKNFTLLLFCLSFAASCK